jgi:hypothetical protein
MIKELMCCCARFSAVIHVQLLGRKEDENGERRPRKHTYEVVRKPERMDNITVDMHLNVNATVHVLVVSYSAGLEIYFLPSHAGGALRVKLTFPPPHLQPMHAPT